MNVANITAQKPLTISKIDNYTYTVPKKWLGSEIINSLVVTVDEKVTKNASGIINNALGVSITGLVAGDSYIKFDYTTDGGRSDCASIIVKVTAEC